MKKGYLCRVLSLLIVVIMFVSVITACGSQETQAPDQTEEPGTSEPASSETDSSDTEGSDTESKEPGNNQNASDAKYDYTCKDPESVTGRLLEWNWNPAFTQWLIENVPKKFPNLKFEGVVVGHPDYLQKLQSSLAAGTEVPDIILGEKAFWGKIIDMDILENIEKPPYNFDRTDLFPYLQELLSNSRGEIVGVDQQACPAGFAYRKDLTKKYFGVEEPEEVHELVSSWDKFIETGKQLKEKSDGKVFMMAGMSDVLKALRFGNPQEYVEGDTVNLTKWLKEPFELAFKIRDEGIIAKYEEGTPAWNAAQAKGDVIFWNCASWTPRGQMSQNDREHGKGRWGLTKGPQAFTLGGTIVGIYKGSKNKEAAWEYIKYIYLSKEGVGETYKAFGYIPGVKSFYESDCIIDKVPGKYDEFFGGQNLARYYVDNILPEIKAVRQTKYDSVVESLFVKLMPKFISDTNMTAQEALDEMISEFKLLCPEVTVK